MTIRILCQALAFAILSVSVFAQTAPRKATPKPSNAPIDIVIGEDDVLSPLPGKANSSIVEPEGKSPNTIMAGLKSQSAMDSTKTDKAINMTVEEMMESFLTDILPDLKAGREINREMCAVALTDLDSQSKLRNHISTVKRHTARLKVGESKVRQFQSDLAKSIESSGQKLSSSESKLMKLVDEILPGIAAMSQYPAALEILETNWGAWVVEPGNPTRVKFESTVSENDVKKFNTILDTIDRMHEVVAAE